jgi:hypothetical protein
MWLPENVKGSTKIGLSSGLVKQLIFLSFKGRLAKTGPVQV